MRERTQVQTRVLTFRDRHIASDGTEYEYGPFEQVRTSSVNYIEDVNNGRSRPKVSPAFHLRVSEAGPFATSWTDLDGTGITYLPHGLAPDAGNVSSRLYSFHVEYSGRSVTNRLNEEFAKITNDVNVLETVQSILELEGLIKPLLRYRYTDYAFAAKPTALDAIALLDNLAFARSRLTKLRKTLGESKRFSSNTSARIVENPRAGDVVFSGKPKARVEGYYTVTIPELAKPLEDMFLWMDVIGIHPDVSALWELVPFSWLIDWVLPIGDILSGLVGKGWLSAELNIFDAAVHLRWEGYWMYYPYADSVPSTNSGGFKFYKRTDFNPGATITGSGFGLALITHRAVILSDVFGGKVKKALR